MNYKQGRSGLVHQYDRFHTELSSWIDNKAQFYEW